MEHLLCAWGPATSLVSNILYGYVLYTQVEGRTNWKMFHFLPCTNRMVWILKGPDISPPQDKLVTVYINFSLLSEVAVVTWLFAFWSYYTPCGYFMRTKARMNRNHTHKILLARCFGSLLHLIVTTWVKASFKDILLSESINLFLSR